MTDKPKGIRWRHLVPAFPLSNTHEGWEDCFDHSAVPERQCPQGEGPYAWRHQFWCEQAGGHWSEEPSHRHEDGSASETVRILMGRVVGVENKIAALEKRLEKVDNYNIGDLANLRQRVTNVEQVLKPPSPSPETSERPTAVGHTHVIGEPCTPGCYGYAPAASGEIRWMQPFPPPATSLAAKTPEKLDANGVPFRNTHDAMGYAAKTPISEGRRWTLCGTPMNRRKYWQIVPAGGHGHPSDDSGIEHVEVIEATAAEARIGELEDELDAESVLRWEHFGRLQAIKDEAAKDRAAVEAIRREIARYGNSETAYVHVQWLNKVLAPSPEGEE